VVFEEVAHGVANYILVFFQYPVFQVLQFFRPEFFGG
jgi:hypothetical protein